MLTSFPNDCCFELLAENRKSNKISEELIVSLKLLNSIILKELSTTVEDSNLRKNYIEDIKDVCLDYCYSLLTNRPPKKEYKDVVEAKNKIRG